MMKNKLVRQWGLGIFVLASMMVPKNAFAMHAYGADTCSTVAPNGKTLTIELASDYAVAPHKIDLSQVAPALEGKYLGVSWDQSDESADDPVSEAALVLKMHSEVRSDLQKIDDGCFQGESWNATRMADVLSVSQEVSRLFGLKAGKTLTFSCEEEFEAPEGSHCY